MKKSELDKLQILFPHIDKITLDQVLRESNNECSTAYDKIVKDKIKEEEDKNN